MTTVLVISLIIVAAVLVLSILTLGKAYNYKHTVDPVEKNPHLDDTNEHSNNKNI